MSLKVVSRQLAAVPVKRGLRWYVRRLGKAKKFLLFNRRFANALNRLKPSFRRVAESRLAWRRAGLRVRRTDRVQDAARAAKVGFETMAKMRPRVARLYRVKFRHRRRALTGVMVIGGAATGGGSGYAMGRWYLARRKKRAA